MIRPVRSTRQSMGHFRCLVCGEDEHACTVGYSNVWNHIQSRTHFFAVCNFERETSKTLDESNHDHAVWLSRCGLEKKHDGFTVVKMKRRKVNQSTTTHLDTNASSFGLPPQSEPAMPSDIPTQQPHEQYMSNLAQFSGLTQHLLNSVSGLTNPHHRA
jgi:hypothetical protein